MRLLIIIAVLLAAPMAGCGSHHKDTTVIAQPGSTVVTSGNAKVVKDH